MSIPTNPFIGPRPFTIGQKLYGRDREIRALHSLLRTKRLVLLHSPSGAGKTSLIQAGLWPHLEASFRMRRPIRVNIAPDGTAASLNRYVYSTFQSLDPTGFKDLVGSQLAGYRFGGEDTRPELWIFDQFEEVLSLDPTDDKIKREFFEQIAETLGDPEYPRWALFAMREDYLGAMEPYLKLLPTGLRSRFRLELLNPEAARQAIDGLAEEGGGSFDPQAVDVLISDLRKSQVQFADGRIETSDGPVVEPMQLQVVCQWLWDRAAQRGTPVTVLHNDVLTPAQPDSTVSEPTATGIIDLALAGYYAGRLKAIAGSLSRERRIRDWFERQLITDRGLRNQIIRDTKSQAVDDETLQALIQAWLVREEPRGGRIWIELSHDRLIRPIRRDNAEWRKGLSRFQQKFEEWQRGGRMPDLLLRGAALLEAEAWVREHAEEVLPEEHEYLDKSQEARGRAEREQGTNLQQTGWGVVLAPGTDSRVRAALAELLEYRQDMAGKLYQVFEYRAGETAAQFLARHGAPAGLPDPEKVPYYLLLVGGPEVIPFEVQYGLDMNYAVGRLAFDTPEEYARYARSLIAAETGQVALPREVGVFAPQHPDDQATKVMHETLVKPLLERLGRDIPEWQTTPTLAEEATRERLGRLLGGSETPALLFLAGHGMGFPNGDTRQLPHQGALLCQDWPGTRQWHQPIPQGFYFAGDDVGDDARLLGLIAFLDSAYTAGTPEFDDFNFLSFSSTPKPIAPGPFVARLPQRLLSHPAGGALAIIGHVDRNFPPYEVTESVSNIFGVLKRLMTGYTVGAAMDAMNQRYTQLAVWLGELMRPLVFGAAGRDRDLDAQLQSLQTAVIDARNFIILGDPAARLPIDPDATAAVRPTIQPVQIQAGADALPATVVTPTAEGVFTLEIELRRKGSDPQAGYAATLRAQRPGNDIPAAFIAEVAFDFAALQIASGNGAMETYGRKLGENLFGQPGPDGDAEGTGPLAETSSAGGRPGKPTLYRTFVQAGTLALTLGLPLRIQLILDPDAPELHTLRWEALRDPVDGRPLLDGERVSFTRTGLLQIATVSIAPKSVDRIRALVAVPGLSGEEALIREQQTAELERARRALAGIPFDELSQQVTPAALRASLSQGYDILYLVCPMIASSTDIAFLLDGDTHQAKQMGRDELSTIIITLSQAPRLIVLLVPNIRGGSASSLASFAPFLIRAGVPAVVTVEGTANSTMLDIFLPALFDALRRDGRIDSAMDLARAAIRDQPDSWAPVLYVRSHTTRLFQIGPLSPAIMPVILPKDIIPRPELLDHLVSTLTHPTTSIAGLIGLAGSGKGVIAREALNDPRVQNAFPDVRLWMTLGPNPDVAAELRSWMSRLGDDPGRSTALPELSAMLRELLAGRRALLVIEDVENPADLAPFQFTLPGCVQLVITQNRAVLPPNTSVIAVGPMTPEQAVKTLSLGINEKITGPLSDLEPLAARLGYWPLALQLANNLLRERVLSRRQPLRDVLTYMHSALDQQGPAAFDTSGASVTTALETSLRDLSPEQRQRLSELVIFPKNMPIPLDNVAHLWKATSAMASFTLRALVEQLAERSLLDLDRVPQSGQFIRLHPALHDYLAREMADRLPELHGKFLDQAVPALRDPSAADDLTTLTASLDPYLREHLNDHLIAARRTAVLGGIVYSNGLDGATGAYLIPPAPPGELVQLVVSQFKRFTRSERQLLDLLSQSISGPEFTRSVNLDNPAEAGWGVIFASSGDPAIREALQPLIDQRAARSGIRPKVFEVASDTSVAAFLSDNGVTRGRSIVEKVPYYLLIAGDPQQISFEFQIELNTEYATGRLHFDTVAEYATYVQRLIAYETAASAPVPREVLLWAPEATLDRETSLSANFLVQPLADQFTLPGLDKRILRGAHATCDSLRLALSGPQSPAILFTASHSIGYSGPHPDQRSRQGALVGGNWVPGQPIPSESLVTGQDISTNDSVGAMFHFAFASYSAGTSAVNPRDGLSGYSDTQSDSSAFVAELPRRLLALGALGFIGYCGPVSSYPFLETGTGTGSGRLLDGYGRALQQLARGGCAGQALRDLHAIAVLLAASLASDTEDLSYGRQIDATGLVQRWMAWQNARLAILIGDPAARIRQPATK